MDDIMRQELGALLGGVAGLAVGGVMSHLLESLSGRSRLRRAAVWFWAWTIGALAGFEVLVAIGGTRQVHPPRRGVGEWVVVEWDLHMALALALVVGLLAAGAALWLPWLSEAPGRSPARRGRSRRRR